ncbi:hypothetical protein PVAP13_4NG337750 [Panicum virgatum]|uniref:Uncharacterized protein n=1 Tax=Panicum virgatum TaxID=38727 RepID=A0A8T0TG95_PANVG|nr:hypothetical protein PVAP13_4NG337750 [Panicum virgatum]
MIKRPVLNPSICFPWVVGCGGSHVSTSRNSVPARRFSGTRHLLYPFPVYKISAAGAKVFYLLEMIVTSFSGDNIDAAVDYRIK